MNSCKSCNIISCAEAEKWNKIIFQCQQYDFYHTAGYHQMHERQGYGKGLLLIYREEEKIAAMPLLLRSLAPLNGLSAALQSWNDATSVYGYPGPVTSVDKTDTGFLNRFNAALLQSFQELQIIAAFTRLHPVIQNETMLQQIGEISERGLTISIDLSQPEETQRKRYRKGHKYDIKKARQAGVVAYHDKRWNHYDDFLRMYTMTMQRVEARDSYYFDRAYFDMLREALGSIIHLFVAEYEGKIISAALFTFLRGIVQYHLSGSDTNFLRYQGSKVVLDEVRLWASSQGAKVLHLGGGVGSDQDNLFLFKSGFSDKRHVFKIWKCIVNQKMHEQAVTERAEYHGVPYPTVISKPFFPVYRAFD